MRLLPARRKKPEAERAVMDSSLSIQQFVDYFQYGGTQYPFLMNMTLGEPVERPDGTYSSYAQWAYRGNGVIFACMLTRLMLFSEARFSFRQLRSGRPGKLFGTPALGILEKPWPNGTTGDLLRRAIVDVDLGGNFFCERRGNVLNRWRPDWTTILLGSRRLPDDPELASDCDVLGYHYWPGGVGRANPEFYTVEQVAHWAPIPHSFYRWRGMSWLDPYVTEMSADNAAMNHKLKFFENGAVPGILIGLDPQITLEAFEQWKEKAQADLDTITGLNNAYRTLILGGGAKATIVGSTMEQMDFENVQQHGERRICAAAGAGMNLILGLGGPPTYANYAEAKTALADITMRPLWRDFANSISKLISVPGGSELWYDDRDIPFLREDVKKAADVMQVNAASIKSLIDAGFQPNEARDAVLAGDLSQLGEHTGMVSVQLRPVGPEGTVPPTSPPTKEPPPARSGDEGEFYIVPCVCLNCARHWTAELPQGIRAEHALKRYACPSCSVSSLIVQPPNGHRPEEVAGTELAPFLGYPLLDRADFEAEAQEQDDAGWFERAAKKSAFHWDPTEHPRDQFGKFAKKLGDLFSGDSVAVDSTTQVRKDKDGTYRVGRKGKAWRVGFKSQADAARAALDLSASNNTPESLGGSVEFKDYNDYLDYKLLKDPSVHGADPNDAGTITFGGNENLPTAAAEALLADLDSRLTMMKTDLEKNPKQAATRKLAIKTVQARRAELAKKLAQALQIVGSELPEPATALPSGDLKASSPDVSGTSPDQYGHPLKVGDKFDNPKTGSVGLTVTGVGNLGVTFTGPSGEQYGPTPHDQVKKLLAEGTWVPPAPSGFKPGDAIEKKDVVPGMQVKSVKSGTVYTVQDDLSFKSNVAGNILFSPKVDGWVVVDTPRELSPQEPGLPPQGTEKPSWKTTKTNDIAYLKDGDGKATVAQVSKLEPYDATPKGMDGFLGTHSIAAADYAAAMDKVAANKKNSPSVQTKAKQLAELAKSVQEQPAPRAGPPPGDLISKEQFVPGMQVKAAGGHGVVFTVTADLGIVSPSGGEFPHEDVKPGPGAFTVVSTPVTSAPEPFTAGEPMGHVTPKGLYEMGLITQDEVAAAIEKDVDKAFADAKADPGVAQVVSGTPPGGVDYTKDVVVSYKKDPVHGDRWIIKSPGLAPFTYGTSPPGTASAKGVAIAGAAPSVDFKAGDEITKHQFVPGMVVETAGKQFVVTDDLGVKSVADPNKGETKPSIVKEKGWTYVAANPTGAPAALPEAVGVAKDPQNAVELASEHPGATWKAPGGGTVKYDPAMFGEGVGGYEVTQPDGVVHNLSWSESAINALAKTGAGAGTGGQPASVEDASNSTVNAAYKQADTWVKHPSGAQVMYNAGLGTYDVKSGANIETNLQADEAIVALTHAKPPPKIKSFQVNILHPPSKYTTDEGGGPALFKELQVAPGDVVQYKKGGWKYTVINVQPSGAVDVKSSGGTDKHWSSYAKPYAIQKADGSQLQLKDPGQVPTPTEPKVGASAADITNSIAVAAAAPGKPFQIGKSNATIMLTHDGYWDLFLPGIAGTQSYSTSKEAKDKALAALAGEKGPKYSIEQIKAALSEPPAGGPTIAQLPDGAVVGTPGGKVYVMKPGVDAADGYVAGYDIETGEKHGIPKNNPPFKWINTSTQVGLNFQQAANDHWAQVKGGAATGVTPPAPPKVKPGEAAFKNVASGSAAHDILPKGQHKDHQLMYDMTGSGWHETINQVSSGGKMKEIEPKWAKRAAAIAKLIADSPPLTEDVHLLRKTGNPDWIKMAPGSVVFTGISASSWDKNAWSGTYTQHILVRAGGHALDISPHSSHQGENEVELPAGMYSIIDVDPNTNEIWMEALQ